jgi:hypothetical protein
LYILASLNIRFVLYLSSGYTSINVYQITRCHVPEDHKLIFSTVSEGNLKQKNRVSYNKLISCELCFQCGDYEEYCLSMTPSSLVDH